MTFLLRSLVVSFFIICTQDIHAEEKIEGAFGKKFGEVFDPATAMGKSTLTDGTVMYQFTPEKPYRSLSK